MYGIKIQNIYNNNIYFSEKLRDLNTQLLYQLFKDLGVSSRLIFSSDSVLTQNGLLKEGDFKASEYIQVFSDRFEFFPDLSILFGRQDQLSRRRGTALRITGTPPGVSSYRSSVGRSIDNR